MSVIYKWSILNPCKTAPLVLYDENHMAAVGYEPKPLGRHCNGQESIAIRANGSVV